MVGAKDTLKKRPHTNFKTMNRANDFHVPYPFYCRQRILSESIFKPKSRKAQEWACGSVSRLEEERLSFAENSPLPQILATDRSMGNSSNDENPGKFYRRLTPVLQLNASLTPSTPSPL